MMKLFLIAFFIYISIDTSLRELSKEFNIPKSVLHRHIAAATKGTQLKQKAVGANRNILRRRNFLRRRKLLSLPYTEKMGE